MSAGHPAAGWKQDSHGTGDVLRDAERDGGNQRHAVCGDRGAGGHDWPIFLSNTTGGILTLQAPATGMLGSDVLTIPIPAGSTDTFALLGTPESFTAATTFTTTVVMSGLPTACTGIVGSKKLANVSGTLTVC